MGKALVTGGCGFLGSSIVERLLSRGIGVRVLALPDEPTDNLEGMDVEIVRGNVLEREACEAAARGMETVFHAAAVYKAWAPDPTPMYRVNNSGTFNMLEAARRNGVKQVVYTASVVALGRPPLGQVADEETPYEAWDLDFAYSRSKYHSRELAEDFARWGMDVRVVCPGVVLGPGDIAPTPSGKLIINTLRGGPPVWVESGSTYVDVRDAAEVHVLAAEKGRPGERYVATAHNLSTLELMQAIDRAAGRSRRYVKVPASLARAMVIGMETSARLTGGEPLVTRNFFEYSLRPPYFSGAKSERELGASYRPIDETIRDAVEYFRRRGLL